MKTEIKLRTEYIKLDQLLKLSGIAESGSMAKELILDRIVSVNGVECTMRGKKIRAGDAVTVDFGGETLEVTVS